MTKNSDLQRWTEDGQRFGWVVPAAPWWKRLPGIRHFRAAIGARAVAKHNRFYGALGLMLTGYDEWVLYGIFHGYERKEK